MNLGEIPGCRIGQRGVVNLGEISSCRIGQRGVGIVNLDEIPAVGLRPRRVRVVFLGQAPVRRLDLLWRRISRDSEDLVQTCRGGRCLASVNAWEEEALIWKLSVGWK